MNLTKLPAPTVLHGDCIEVMRTMEPNSIDAIVTDPPYGLGFMGKAWDALPPGKEWAEECLRVLKPGGHILAFGGSRTWHRLAVAIEDAGFEIRESIFWHYGSGFPKSHNVSASLDGKRCGCPVPVERGSQAGGRWEICSGCGKPKIPDGLGTALKPATEPIVMGRKPFKGTVANNVILHGTGALNIDASRIGNAGGTRKGSFPNQASNGIFGDGLNGGCKIVETGNGRWPANVVLDEYMAELLDQQSGNTAGRVGMKQHGSGTNAVYGSYSRTDMSTGNEGVKDSGGASRFFYVAKAPKKERPNVDGTVHATVKPLTLMRHLIKLVTPVGGTVLDTFGGSGTTAEAAMLEGYKSIIIEREAEYLPLIQHRVDRVTA